MGGKVTALPFSARVSLVWVSLSLATAPRSPARSSVTPCWVLPCITVSAPSRSLQSRVALCADESDRSVPAATRNIVMRPANGSAMVFQTNAAGGASSPAS